LLLITFGQLINKYIVGVDVNSLESNNEFLIPGAVRVNSSGYTHVSVTDLEFVAPHIYESEFTWLVDVKLADKNTQALPLFIRKDIEAFFFIVIEQTYNV
jgi:hypothetical protein